MTKLAGFALGHFQADLAQLRTLARDDAPASPEQQACRWLA